MQVILNIGLARTGASNLTRGDILDPIAREGLRATSIVLLPSDTELTAVVTADFGGFATKNAVVGQAVYRLSDALGQDCIGVWFPRTSEGRLIGPRSDAWGDFNPEFFLLPNGSSLQAQALAA